MNEFEGEIHGNYDKEFETLQGLVNKNVTCIYWSGGERYGESGVLTKVEDYDKIFLNGQAITFIGPYLAIQAIFDENNNVVFLNDHTIKYQGCGDRDLFFIMNEQERQLGYSVEKAKFMSSSNKR